LGNGQGYFSGSWHRHYTGTKLDVKNGSINTSSIYHSNLPVLAAPIFGNLFVGIQAGNSNQGYYNTFSGYRAGCSIFQV
jgi:hypothetical protein